MSKLSYCFQMDGSIQVICPDSIQIGPRKENAVVHVTKVTGEGPAECLLSLPKKSASVGLRVPEQMWTE